ncbi:prolyl oligopeptidase family serine peptidase [Kribbella sp. NBC_01245]|uniref:prolyl oligopeptidase family serine peptidase n=1 Tax=Kribbella sp. NBC_01245 TaxID=2903578 RepID=UPI002E280E88|nr:prolyl oligopeptidase family serine peptidase [Kribbella sp. NBC_01245]
MQFSHKQLGARGAAVPRRRLSVATALVVIASMVVGAAPAVGATRQEATTQKATLPGRPGPDILYAPPAAAPQLENARPWRATPLMVSGASAYRDGEFLYQDYLYDDLGASELYTYPTYPDYAGNAADLVEIRLRPLREAMVVRLTYNTMLDPELVATTIALGDSPLLRAMPHGANTRAPGQVFVTVHGSSGDAVNAATGQRIPYPAVGVSVSPQRRQVDVQIPYGIFDPRGQTGVRVAAATGLWDRAAGRYLIPQAVADERHPGGASGLTPSAFFNVGFRYDEPLVGTQVKQIREKQQSEALAAGDISPFFATVDFVKLASRVDDELRGKRGGAPTSGVMNRIYASHFEDQQGRGSAASLQTENCAQGCAPDRAGQLQSYSIYLPARLVPSAGYGLTIMLHGSGSTENSYQASHMLTQLGEREGGSIILMPEGRGPSYFYYGQAAADIFEAWADIARAYHLDPSNTALMGGSMGGYGTYKLASMFPDLFEAILPIVPCPSGGVLMVPGGPVPGGEASAIVHVAPSLRHVPSLSLQSVNDEACQYSGDKGAAAIFKRLDELNYEYEAYSFIGAEHAAVGLLLLDDATQAVDFFTGRRVVTDPAHVTYVVNEEMSQPQVGLNADHAYWLSGLKVRDTSGPPIGSVDAVSSGLGKADPAPVATESGQGVYPTNPYPYVFQRKRPGQEITAPKQDRLHLNLTNVGAVTVDPARAGLTCAADIEVATDGPVTVNLAGCGRTLTAG